MNIVTNKHWVAGNYIDLMPGLEVWPVADFTAEIEPCNSSNRMLHMDTLMLTCPVDTLQLFPPYSELSFISYLWDFGNGETSNEETGSVFYNQPGQYDITLTVIDSLSNNYIFTQTVVVPEC